MEADGWRVCFLRVPWWVEFQKDTKRRPLIWRGGLILRQTHVLPSGWPLGVCRPLWLTPNRGTYKVITQVHDQQLNNLTDQVGLDFWRKRANGRL